MEQKKIKVAMICHFSNNELREHLDLSKMTLTNSLLKILKQREFAYGDYAHWINSIAIQCHLYEQLEMHIIAPHFGLKKELYEFTSENVSYHIFNNSPSFLAQGIYRKMLHYKGLTFRKNRKMVHTLLDRINPDLIVLVGSENPDYSTSVLGLKGVPIYLLCQSVYSNDDFRNFYDKGVYEYRANIERMILESTPYVGVYCDMHARLLRELGYEKFIFNFQWPGVIKQIVTEPRPKVYDFINFANTMSRQKGYHDSIEALAIVKEQYPKVSMVLIDHGPKNVENELKAMIKKYALEENITFVPFFENKEDILQFLEQVKFAVLPCKVDYISGTQVQSLERGLPIVVYETEGTPTLNEVEECALIAKMNDVEGLAQHMIALLKDEDFAKRLGENGRKYVQRRKEMKRNAMRNLLADFNAIIDNYHNGTEIPMELLNKRFDTKKA